MARQIIPFCFALIAALLPALNLIGGVAESPHDANLSGTAWLLVATGPSDGELEPVMVQPEDERGPYEVRFFREGGYAVTDADEYGLWTSNGCAPSTAAYATASDGTFLTGAWNVAARDCSIYPDLFPFFENLKDAVSYELVNDDSLRIYHAHGREVLVFKSAATGNTVDNANLRSSSVRFISTSPNPFRESTTLHFSVDHPGPVRLMVYDLVGREVAILIDDFMPAGDHSTRWDATRVSAGTYVVRLSSGGQFDSQQLTLVR